MKIFLIVIVITFICVVQPDSYDYEYDDNHGEDTKYFDLRGTLRQYFGLEAALISPDSSSICSPISALLPIGKLALGAEGKTLDELNTAIGVISDLSYDYDSPIDELTSHLKGVLKILKLLPGVILDVASKLYISNTHRLRSKFSKLAKKIFDTAVEEVDFEDTTRVVNNINGWVASETHGMIPSILARDDISQDSSLVIVNAIYFAGKWKYPFPEVHAGPFHSPKGTRPITMMSRTEDYEYGFSKILFAQIVRIPYEGGKASFLIILPKERNGLDLVLTRLKDEPAVLQWELSNLIKTKVKLTIPKFKIESEWNLEKLYKKIGVSRIFKKKKSELKNIVRNETLIVSAAIQKAVIEVNELGTEAAVSSVLGVLGSAKIEEIFTADRPFIFYIMAKTQQLFVGTFC